MATLQTLLGIRCPLLGAPMAGISGGRLAAAVSRAGGLGFIGGGYGDRDWLVEQLACCDGQPFGVGFITWALARRPHLRLSPNSSGLPRWCFLAGSRGQGRAQPGAANP